MCIGIFPICILCTAWVPGSHEGQKRPSDALELELCTVVSCHVSAWTWIQSGLEEEQLVETSLPSINISILKSPDIVFLLKLERIELLFIIFWLCKLHVFFFLSIKFNFCFVLWVFLLFYFFICLFVFRDPWGRTKANFGMFLMSCPVCLFDAGSLTGLEHIN